jgi:hypothetical protein
LLVKLRVKPRVVELLLLIISLKLPSLLEPITKTKISTKSKLMSPWVLNMSLSQKKDHLQINIDQISTRLNISQELHTFAKILILTEDLRKLSQAQEITILQSLSLLTFLTKWNSVLRMNLNQKKDQPPENIT